LILTWKPKWYELDQTVIVGDVDYFYLDKYEESFANDFGTDKDIEVRGKIVKITHPELGELLGILAIGLSYKIFLKDGKHIQVDAEEDIGRIEYPNDCIVNEWLFTVDLRILEVTGFTSQDRLKHTIQIERQTLQKQGPKRLKEIAEKYKRLLNVKSL
jgi:hypothetical protein